MMEIEIIGQLILATFLGALIGLEREYKRKEAGLRTFTLVTLGACIFTIISFELFNFFITRDSINFDPSRVIQAIAVGIGFIGAGTIFRQPSGIAGLTTAAGLWTMAAIGVAIGAKLYSLAIFSTLFTLLVLSGFRLLEEEVFKSK